jgi:hypothetical protein
MINQSNFLLAQAKIQLYIFEATNGSRVFSITVSNTVDTFAFWLGVSVNMLMVIGLQHSSGFRGYDQILGVDVYMTLSVALAPFFAINGASYLDNMIIDLLNLLVGLSILSYLLAVVLRAINFTFAHGLSANNNLTGNISSTEGVNDDIRPSESSQLWHVIRDSIILSPTKETTRIIFYLVLICCSITFLATGSSDSPGSPVLLSLMLFQFFFRNSYIGLVLQAVTSTAQQLMYTLFGMVIVMFIFAVIAFKYFHNDFDAGQCLEMWSCLLEVLNFGMRNGGGIGDTMTVYNSYTQTFEWVGHSLFDWLFFIIINVIFLNVVFGIIVDQFAELRDQRKEQANDMAHCCPICGADIGEGNNIDEESHFSQHALNKYFYFFVHLEDESSVFDRVGLEVYICEALSNDSTLIDWFPVVNAESLTNTTDNTSHSLGVPNNNNYSEGTKDNYVLDENIDFDPEDAFEQQAQSINDLKKAVSLLTHRNDRISEQMQNLQKNLKTIMQVIQPFVLKTRAESRDDL